jgi:cysteine desulfuration protein SufE
MSELPEPLQRIVDLFAASPRDIKIHALVDYSNRLADPPPGRIDADTMTQVHECQTPFFVAIDLDAEDRVTLYFQVPRESPTIRGYAGILADGLNGQPAEDILAISPTFYAAMGLDDVVSPLRLRGMGAILHRIKALVAEALATAA